MVRYVSVVNPYSLIFSLSENRFKITYCSGNISKEEIESVNFNFADLDEMIKKYNPEILKDGFNTLPAGEEIFYISNPALGLWAYKERFTKNINGGTVEKSF